MNNTPPDGRGWYPAEVKALLIKRFFRRGIIDPSLLDGSTTFPYQISLQAPRGREGADNYAVLDAFIRTWAGLEGACNIVREMRSVRLGAKVRIPVAVEFSNPSEVARFIGGLAAQSLVDYAILTIRLEALKPDSNAENRKVLVSLLPQLVALTPEELDDVCGVVKGAYEGMGTGKFTRQLRFAGVHTKFVEDKAHLVERVLDWRHNGAIPKNTLFDWLGVRSKMGKELLVRPLCDKVCASIGGASLMRLNQEGLSQIRPVLTHVLVIENEVSAYTIQDIPGCLVVAGTGFFVDWLKLPWVQNAKVGYWGDLDHAGMSFLANARSIKPDIQPIMMSAAFLKYHYSDVRTKTKPISFDKSYLTAEERELTSALAVGKDKKYLQLEQELIDGEVVEAQIKHWYENS